MEDNISIDETVRHEKTIMLFSCPLSDNDDKIHLLPRQTGHNVQLASPQATPRFYLTAVEKKSGCEIKSGSGLGTRLMSNHNSHLD